MKIVDICEFYSERGGGVRSYVRQKLAAADALGHEVLIIAPGATDDEERVGRGRIRWVKSPSERFDRRYHRFDDVAAVHAILDRESPDFLEASSPWKGGEIAARWLGRAPRALVLHNDPVAVYAHSFFDQLLSPDRIDRLFGRMWRHLAKLSTGFDSTVVADHWLAQRFSKYGIANCQVVPFGIEKHKFSPTLRDESVRRQMLAACGLKDENAKLLIAVSRHHPEKRVSLLIDAAARIGVKSPVGLFIVGDGPMRGLMERLAAQVDNVCIAGACDQATLAVRLASADALIHAGAAETFGLAIAEGLCSGLPMILPDRGGAAQLAGQDYAETYAAGDLLACVAAAERLMTRDRVAMSTAACEATRRISSSTAHFARLFDTYEALVERRPLAASA
jgi:alpha-1,6-mannosyltransferase